jgi:hypothetical protein
MSGCSGSDEQELNKRRERTKLQCMEILFPDEVKQQQQEPTGALTATVDAMPPNQEILNQPPTPNTVPVSQLEPQLPPKTDSDNNNNNILQQTSQPQEVGTPSTDPVPNPPPPPSTQPASPSPPSPNNNNAAGTNSNANANANAAKKPNTSTGSTKATASTSTYILLLSIVVIFVLHFLIYVFALSSVIKSNTEQMNKMVNVLEELNLRLRRMNGEPEVIEEEQPLGLEGEQQQLPQGE